MNILLATMSMGIGGAETHILELAKELKKRGNNVYVVSNGGTYTDELREFGIEHIWAPLHNKNPKNMLVSYKILKKVIEEKHIDIVHSHARIPSFICGLLKKRLKFPFVTSAHWTFKITPLLRLMTNWGDGTVAVSEDIKDYLMKNYNVKEGKIIVTFNGIDTEKFSKDVDTSSVEKEFGLNHNKRKIVYISRLDDSRALVARQLINIAKQLEASIENIQIVIVGGGNVFDELKATADLINQGREDKLIIMTGARSDINRFAAYGEIFIGVSRSALEAMACEVPVIVAGNEGYLGIFDGTKLQKGIETNFCCRGLEMPTEDKLRKDIIKLMEHTEETKKTLGQYGRKTVKDYYSVEKMTDDCIQMYEKVKNS